jgi:hypothetical protein
MSIEGSQVKIEVTIDLSHSMLTSEKTSEKNIQNIINEAVQMSIKATLKYLDTNTSGSPIKIAGKVMLIRGEQAKANQSPYGQVVVERHNYHQAFFYQISIRIWLKSNLHPPSLSEIFW